MTIDFFKSSLIDFLDQLDGKLQSTDIDVSNFLLDHVCWRCATLEEYTFMSNFLENNGTLFHKSHHNGREVSLFNLQSPITHKGRSIDQVELPAPKSNKNYPSGFEHAEFVVAENLHLWQQQYTVNWDLKNINKDINPDVRISFGDICAKFHPYSLSYVVKHLE